MSPHFSAYNMAVKILKVTRIVKEVSSLCTEMLRLKLSMFFHKQWR